MLHGAGTKTKLIQTLTVGTPAVSTSIGIEGLNLTPREQVLVADQPEQFAEEIVRLTRDRELWEKLSLAGRRHIAILHGREAVRKAFLVALSTLFQTTLTL